MTRSRSDPVFFPSLFYFLANSNIPIAIDHEDIFSSPWREVLPSQAPDVDDARNTSLVVQDSSDVVCKEAVGGSAEVLGRGISSILENLISVFLDRAEGVGQSQVQLSNGIDRLTRELDQLLEDAPMPFIMQHASKISGLCKRVSSLNTILKSIQQRIDNIDHMLSLESSQGVKNDSSSRENTSHQSRSG